MAYPDETLRAVAERMASRRLFVLPVVERDSGKLLGLLNAEDVLHGRARAHERATAATAATWPTFDGNASRAAWLNSDTSIGPQN